MGSYDFQKPQGLSMAPCSFGSRGCGRRREGLRVGAAAGVGQLPFLALPSLCGWSSPNPLEHSQGFLSPIRGDRLLGSTVSPESRG